MKLSNKFILFPGFAISMFGSSIFSFTAGLYLLLTTGKGGTFATNMILWALPPIVLGPFLGLLVDRFPKKKVIVIADILNGLLMMALFILWNNLGNKEILIYTGTFLTSFLAFFVQIAFSASRPELFPEEWLVKSNSITNTLDSMSNILGPFLGGIIYSLIDFKYIILINGASFFISAAFECFLKYSKRKIEKKEKINFFDGINCIMKSKYLLVALGVGILLNLGQGVMLLVPIPYVIKNVLGYSDRVYGIIQGILSMGLIISSLIVTKFNKNILIEKVHRVFYGFSLVGGLFSLPLFFDLNSTANIAVYSVGMFIFGFLLLFINVSVMTTLQTKTESRLMGQVIATFIGIVRVILPVSLFFGGVFTDMSPKIGFITGAVIYITGALSFTYFWSRDKAVMSLSHGTCQGIIEK